MRRRAFLALASGATLATLAGCTGGSGTQVHGVSEATTDAAADEETGRPTTDEPDAEEESENRETAESDEPTETSASEESESETETPEEEPPEDGGDGGEGKDDEDGEDDEDGDDEEALSESEFADRLAGAAMRNGFRSDFSVDVEGGVAVVRYSEPSGDRGEKRDPWLLGYADVVANDEVRHDVEGRIFEDGRRRWYTYEIRRSWAEAYADGEIDEAEYRERVGDTESEWE